MTTQRQQQQQRRRRRRQQQQAVVGVTPVLCMVAGGVACARGSRAPWAACQGRSSLGGCWRACRRLLLVLRALKVQPQGCLARTPCRGTQRVR
jgi:hypothetical protein